MADDYSIKAFNRHMVQQDKAYKLVPIFNEMKDARPTGYEITSTDGCTVYGT